MRGTIVTIMLVLALFVFGCTGPTPSLNKSTVPTNPVGNGTSPPGTVPSGQTSPSGQPAAGSGGSDFTGKDYVALLALGVPVQCDITSTYNGKTTNIKMYLKGSAEARMEIPDNSSCKGQIVMVTKNQKIYMGCNVGTFMPNCDWLTFDSKVANSSVGTGGVTNPTGAPDLTNIPSTQMNCGPWIYDQSKLETPGKICDFSQIGAGD